LDIKRFTEYLKEINENPPLIDGVCYIPLTKIDIEFLIEVLESKNE